MKILGISAFYHDSAAALVIDGQVIAAAQEERFSRKKHDSHFPAAAIRSILAQSGTALSDVDAVVFYDKPFVKFERLFDTILAVAPRGFKQFRDAFPIWIREKLFLKTTLLQELKNICGTDLSSKLLFSEHHLSHAASAFYPSPFDEACVLTLDGVGEWATSTVAHGKNEKLELEKEIRFPHSLGLLYSTFTTYCGFSVNSGEYKLMGLAPYGRPIYRQKILDHLIQMLPDGSYRLDLSYFDYCHDVKMYSQKFCDLFGGPARDKEGLLDQRHMDLAASIQAVLEEVILHMTRHLAEETGYENLCLAGGVALNCVANGKILRDGKFKNIWIQPAAGDAGGAIGAALAAYHQHFNQPRAASPNHDQMAGAYLGPESSEQEIVAQLEAAGARFEKLTDNALIAQTAQDLAAGHAIGWHQGRMEFGPRALGARSILGDARSTTMQTDLNLKVKFRESFRPFAPVVLREHLNEWFDLDCDSPYMLLVANVQENKRTKAKDEDGKFGIDLLKIPRSVIPAVTHVDGSARVQTVHKDTNPKFHALMQEFHRLTGVPVLVNTSFNVRGEPIVCTPADSFRCFMGTDIDRLAVGNFYLKKEDQDANLFESYQNKFELD